jgi:hypothetical protein
MNHTLTDVALDQLHFASIRFSSARADRLGRVAQPVHRRKEREERLITTSHAHQRCIPNG